MSQSTCLLVTFMVMEILNIIYQYCMFLGMLGIILFSSLLKGLFCGYGDDYSTSYSYNSNSWSNTANNWQDTANNWANSAQNNAQNAWNDAWGGSSSSSSNNDYNTCVDAFHAVIGAQAAIMILAVTLASVNIYWVVVVNSHRAEVVRLT